MVAPWLVPLVTPPPMRFRSFVLPALLPPLAGCIERISAPACTAGTSTQASVSGDTVTTTTGLRYIEGTAGPGAAVDWCQNVAIHYTASILDGPEFDTSRGGAPLVFAPGVGGVIDGVEEGVVGVRVGGTRRLIIPPGLAFGPEPRRNVEGEVIIPGNSTVVFDIEVVGAAPR